MNEGIVLVPQRTYPAALREQPGIWHFRGSPVRIGGRYSIDWVPHRARYRLSSRWHIS